jgi:hypothetical protein
MNTFLLLVVLSSPPVMYVALDDEGPSELMYAEMTRDWTASPHMTKEALPLAKSINEDIAELKSLIKIEFQRPHFLRTYPAFRFSKYQKWVAFDKRAFNDSSFPYKTLMYQAYSYYGESFNERFQEDYYTACEKYLDNLHNERVEFAQQHKNYTLKQPKSHQAGWGDVYNLHTRKYEKINFRKKPLYIPFDLDKHKQWAKEKEAAAQKFCTRNAEDYTRRQPHDHRAGWGDVYNLTTRKYENIESKVIKPVLMELRVDPPPYVGGQKAMNKDG